MSPQWSPSLRFPLQDPIHPLSSPTHVTCPAHLILLDFITRTILSEEYKSFSSTLCSLHHVRKQPQLPFLPQCQRPSFTPIQNNREGYIGKTKANGKRREAEEADSTVLNADGEESLKGTEEKRGDLGNV